MIVDETVDVAALAQRLSELGEDAALNYFWIMMRDGAKPLMILGWMGKVNITRPAEWDKSAIRAQHESGGGSLNSRINKTECYGCKAENRNLYFHHIIEVQNGGSNHCRNFVPLCFDCHKSLHPWLTVEPKPTRGGGFIHLGTVINDMFARIKARK